MSQQYTEKATEQRHNILLLGHFITFKRGVYGVAQGGSTVAQGGFGVAQGGFGVATKSENP